MATERYLEPDVAEALDRLRGEIPDEFVVVGEYLDVLFPAANTARDIQHGLGVVPTGYQVILELGGKVRANSITSWSTELAFLQADAANTRAIVRFVKTRKDPINA